MTLDALLALAQEEIADQAAHTTASGTPYATEERSTRAWMRATKLAHGVIDLLGESLPRDYDSATVNEMPWRTVNLPHQWCVVDHRPHHARALAAALLRAADEAEKGTSRG